MTTSRRWTSRSRPEFHPYAPRGSVGGVNGTMAPYPVWLYCRFKVLEHSPSAA